MPLHDFHVQILTTVPQTLQTQFPHRRAAVVLRVQHHFQDVLRQNTLIINFILQ